MWNLDEVGVSHKDRSMLVNIVRSLMADGRAEARTTYAVQRGERNDFWATIIFFVNAAGRILPPCIVHEATTDTAFYRQNIPDEWLDSNLASVPKPDKDHTSIKGY